ncbi:MAG: lysophospholipid acyltransferase family protein [Candidatus Moranbacteria bacterium]|nr:lysophospholipid acyltransferase family protein [Candidatus Moranbacteria bacterium]
MAEELKSKNISQIVAFALFASWLRYILRIEVKEAENIYIKKPLIIVSNHRSKLDPFLIMSALGWKNFLRANPWRFPLHKIYAESWWLGPISRLIGCYKIEGKGDLNQSLKTTLSVIDQKRSLIFFPEGQVTRKNEKIEPKRGIGYICLKKNVSILPVKIKPNGFKDNKKARLWKSKIIIGNIFESHDLQKKNKSQNLHLMVMERVNKLK